MGLFKSRATAPAVKGSGDQEATSSLERLERLENAVRTLQLDSAERQLAVLNAMEKALRQLAQREAKRVESTDAEADLPEAAAMGGMVRGAPARGPKVPERESTAHLARRFRLGG